MTNYLENSCFKKKNVPRKKILKTILVFGTCRTCVSKEEETRSNNNHLFLEITQRVKSSEGKFL